MKKIIISIMLLLLFGFAKAAEKDTRTVEDYSKLIVCCNIEVIIMDGDKYELEIEANINTKYIITEVKNKSLQIMFRPNIPKHSGKNPKVKVYIYKTNLSEISVTSEASVKMENSVIKSDCVINISDKATAKLEIDNKNIVVNASDKAKVIIIGTSKAGTFNLSSDAKVDAYGLKMEKVIAIANSYSDLEIYVTEELIANSGYRAKIRYRGNPKIKNLNEGWSSNISEIK